MKRYLIALGVVAVCAVILGGILPDVQAGNAESAYCSSLGGTPNGLGACDLPNGTRCNETVLFGGGCVGWPGSPNAGVTVYNYRDDKGNQLREGDLISAAQYSDPDIFIVKLSPHGLFAGYKRVFLNPAIFNMYGHLGGFANVRPVSPAVRDLFETSVFFRNCETDNQRVWAAEVTGEDDGILHHVDISGDAAFREDPLFFLRVFCINTREDNFYPKSIHPYTRLADVPRYQRTQTCSYEGQAAVGRPCCSGMNPDAQNVCRRYCQPRPACLDTVPRCYPPEPAEGWCPVPTMPPGCYIQQIQCFTVPCDQPLVCPAGTYDHVFIRGVSLQPITVTSPISFQATITGDLASPCYSLLPLSSVQSGDAFFIVVRAGVAPTMNPDCAQVLVPFERSVTLTPTGQTSGQYRVYVNGTLGATYDVPR